MQDGDGLFPSGLPGVGLIEPNPPGPGIPDPGDNLDALDLDTTPADLAGFVFFSLDSSFLDPLELSTPNTSTAAFGNGYSGADVLVSFAGAAFPPFRFRRPFWGSTSSASTPTTSTRSTSTTPISARR